MICAHFYDCQMVIWCNNDKIQSCNNIDTKFKCQIYLILFKNCQKKQIDTKKTKERERRKKLSQRQKPKWHTQNKKSIKEKDKHTQKKKGKGKKVNENNNKKT